MRKEEQEYHVQTLEGLSESRGYRFYSACLQVTIGRNHRKSDFGFIQENYFLSSGPMTLMCLILRL